MARIKKNLRRITIEKEACKKLSSCQGSSKSKIQTKSTFLPEQMRMVRFFDSLSRFSRGNTLDWTYVLVFEDPH